jgi:hypothetical protein
LGGFFGTTEAMENGYEIWKIDIRLDLGEIGWEVLDWIHRLSRGTSGWPL